ncbi:hypothetical protein F5884DRAFT_212023 [Xylogone sp. PMI_703]|nr:hypothetical protein F5884DRAFT_212023 [Xylogone sp. PMI_703]
MVFNTATVGTAVTPAVISTFFSHYLNRKLQGKKPTSHISYDEGLHLIRQFLLYASHHTVEDIQRFTSQWVPHPRWVKVEEVRIYDQYILQAAEYLTAQLGQHGIDEIGGRTWWQWRRPRSELKAEWIEMRADYNERKQNGEECKRVMLYVHGGAYFFGSVDEHRYQMQRHARKLNARVFAPRYRLAPQFPFPCGLHDCLAAYLHLLSIQHPSTIILAGDSAGGGMVLSMLVTLRDRNIPLPAGAILISPWVDLTHSFPSVGEDNPLDYIPPAGFHHRPSPAWPPPNSDDMLAVEQTIISNMSRNERRNPSLSNGQGAVEGFHADHHPPEGMKNRKAVPDTKSDSNGVPIANTIPGPGYNLSIMLDGKLVEVKDQIHMYTTNQLLTHPLVSPVFQPSLGGLPPLLIMVGGGEMLRDEQIYIAHKAANPTKYAPPDVLLDRYPHLRHREEVKKWKPTYVQLQVWDDLCHVAPTLSFTRPAKYMYRSIAQFGAWALARAQKTPIDIVDDDDVSVISSSGSSDEDERLKQKEQPEINGNGVKIGKAGDSIPEFKNHMIRQRVDCHGNVYDLEPVQELQACCMQTSEIGVIKEAPVRKWMEVKKKYDSKYASDKRRVQKQRAKDMAEGYMTFGEDEVPPPSALAGRRKTDRDFKEKKKTKSLGLSLWALWGSKHDEKTIVREVGADQVQAAVLEDDDRVGTQETQVKEGRKSIGSRQKSDYSRSRSRRRVVADEHQTEANSDAEVDENTSALDLEARMEAKRRLDAAASRPSSRESMSIKSDIDVPNILVRTPTLETELHRPKANGIAFPFSLKRDNDGRSDSMRTLTSDIGVPPLPVMKQQESVPPSHAPDNEDEVDLDREEAMSTTAVAGDSVQK